MSSIGDAMNLHRGCSDVRPRAEPVRVGLIGGGKFGSMFLAQAAATPGLQVAAIADLDAGPRAREPGRDRLADASGSRPLGRERAPCGDTC